MYKIDKYSSLLEFDKVLQLLSQEVTLPESKELALKLTPTNDCYEAEKLLKQTEDAYVLTAKFSAPSFGTISGINSILARAQAGSILTIEELLKIGEILRVIRTVKSWRDNCSDEMICSLDEYFSSLYPNRYFEERITFCIKNTEEINDNASSELANIRRKIKSISQNIKNRFDKIIRDGVKNKYLQEGIVTQRDGRYVVPVKAEHKGDVRGIVHDSSATGATLFVEPMDIVELNNDLRVLFSKERQEIENILSELSGEVASFADTISISYNMLLILNLIFAKASLAYKMKASVPKLNMEGKIHLKNARHPLIDKNKIVPITVNLGDRYNTLIVTGPNTGGKTVTLKTVGLLTLMALSGMMIPVDDNSSVAIFDRVLVDIGDEQSIEQSLSTFSSHMVNIIEILNNSNDNSLVLLDELGGGTDPIEGAALARSILQYLYNLGAKILATTHYAELKAYALDTDGIENACFEFNVNTLKPTYRMMVGIPGKSNAFAIAQSLGMCDEIIEKARNGISEDALRFDKIASKLEQARISAEKEREEAVKLRVSLAEQKRNLDLKLADIDNQKRKIIENSRNANIAILEKAKYESDKLLNELEQLKKELNASNAASVLTRAKSMVKGELSHIEELVDPIENKNEEKYILPRDPKIGDTVFIFSINNKAVVESVDLKNKKVSVACGNMKMFVFFDDIKLIDQPKINERKTRTVSGIKSNAQKNISGEIDIRGLNSEEGIMEVDRYIDSCLLTGIESIRIIHGKGTGVLRSSIHAHLRKHKSICDYRLGTFGEGENGVTIATLKK